jgi:hypothetical protein
MTEPLTAVLLVERVPVICDPATVAFVSVPETCACGFAVGELRQHGRLEKNTHFRNYSSQYGIIETSLRYDMSGCSTAKLIGLSLARAI